MGWLLFRWRREAGKPSPIRGPITACTWAGDEECIRSRAERCVDIHPAYTVIVAGEHNKERCRLCNEYFVFENAFDDKPEGTQGDDHVGN
jgi:hypothetical protein